MTDLSKDALDALIEDLGRGVKSCGLHDDMETELFLVDDANDVMASAADAMTALRQQIAAAQCCMCGKAGLSTAEDGGPECELSDGRWVCSRECYDRAMMTCEANQQIAAAEAAALERAAACAPAARDVFSGSCDHTQQAVDYMEQLIRALIAPDAASALAAREAAAERAGYLRGLREAGIEKTDTQRFDAADWFWRVMDPDDNGDTPQEAVSRAMLGHFCVCEIASSFSGPTRFGFVAPVLDEQSDDEEFLHFATQQEAIDAVSGRILALADRAEKGGAA